MNPKIKSILELLFNFFITLSIIVFLLEIFTLTNQNTHDPATAILSTCGLCSIIITITYKYLTPTMKSLHETWMVK